MNEDPLARRDPVDFDYACINPTFLYWMAKIGPYAAKKYGTWQNYIDSRLIGEKSPINHIEGHIKKFKMGEEYDHFDKDIRWHLVAIAYNAMIEFYYVSRWGHLKHPLTIDEKS